MLAETSRIRSDLLPRFAALHRRVRATLERSDPACLSGLPAKYATALGVLALVATATWLSQRFIDNSASLAVVEFNVAARQRLLIERITDAAIRLKERNDADVQASVSRCAEMLMRSHIALIARSLPQLAAVASEPPVCSGGSASWIAAPAAREGRFVKEIELGPEPFDQSVRRFAALALIVSSAVGSVPGDVLDELIAQGTGVLPRRANEITLALQAEAIEDAQNRRAVADLALVVFLAFLFAAWLLTFRPAAAAGKCVLRDLQHKNRLLEERQSEVEAANRQLNRTLDHLQTLSALSGDWYWKTDPQDRFVELSGEVRHSGLDPSKLLGTRLQDLLEPDDSELAALEISLRSQVSFRRIEIRLRQSAGDGPGRWVSLNAEPVFNEQGAFTGFRGVGSDVTSVRNAERLHADHAAKLDAFLEAAPVAVAMFDLEMRYIACTNLWLALHDLDGPCLTGRYHYDVLPCLSEEIRAAHKRALAGGTERLAKVSCITGKGREIAVERLMQPWYDAAGRTGGIIVVTDLVTDGIVGAVGGERATG